MTSWPWMKGIDVAIADPMPLEHKGDERPSVKELIETHRKKIDKVKGELSQDPLYESSKHDDLWILRFVLSHKKTKPSVKAAKYTIKFRKEQNLDEEDFRPFPPIGGKTHPRGEALDKYNTYNDPGTLYCGVPDVKRSVIAYFDLKGLNQEELAANLPESSWLPTYLYLNEWCFQWNDYITRTTGRFTKMIRIADTKGLVLRKIMSGEAWKRDGRTMEIMEDCYPQLLQMVLIANAPVWVQVPWRIIKPFLPKRVVSKTDFIAPAKNEKELQILLKYVEKKYLPKKFGGDYETFPVDYPVPPTG